MKRLEQFDVFALPVSEIFYDPDFNCRGNFTLQSVEDLSQSIGAGGLQFPVVVQPVEDIETFSHGDFRWRLLAGHRRFRAVTAFLRWSEIPAMIRRGLSDRQARMLNFTENLERKDLNPVEEAHAMVRLFPEGTPIREAAQELKRDRRWVHARLRILKLPDEVQLKVAAGTLSLVDVEILSRFTTPEEQIKAAHEIALAKRRGRRPSEGKLSRRFRYRKTKAQINKMIAKMMNHGIAGLTTRSLAWAAGYISDDELDEEIRKVAAGTGASFPVTEDR
ncbi:MAG: ParB/RepB/Spo0J family partition protein [Planctomycetota bacterium]|nr:MAG: ParB/RepB/Spo0J family partition protein [Planctomycetota bacterium]REJ92023.1 MAG: ParB/RepB/Spo0J family partition protein [Planctomycetota bacterium]REK28559.1 MAG: ParB/RepB/Spo0J family partition protein [Planctomycetota bacterium]REK39174.1 MAG: ParB/RepB/Spo0J family partition protein [Planctomycetota bacterium]